MGLLYDYQVGLIIFQLVQHTIYCVLVCRGVSCTFRHRLYNPPQFLIKYLLNLRKKTYYAIYYVIFNIETEVMSIESKSIAEYLLGYRASRKT